jgi:hypothetical protein
MGENTLDSKWTRHRPSKSLLLTAIPSRGKQHLIFKVHSNAAFDAVCGCRPPSTVVEIDQALDDCLESGFFIWPTKTQDRRGANEREDRQDQCQLDQREPGSGRRRRWTPVIL